MTLLKFFFVFVPDRLLWSAKNFGDWPTTTMQQSWETTAPVKLFTMAAITSSRTTTVNILFSFVGFIPAVCFPAGSVVPNQTFSHSEIQLLPNQCTITCGTVLIPGILGFSPLIAIRCILFLLLNFLRIRN